LFISRRIGQSSKNYIESGEATGVNKIGIDFKTCQNCQENFPDCGYYFQCEDCWNALCDDCSKEYKAGRHSGLPWPTGIDEDTGETYKYDGDNRNCPFCELTIVSDEELFKFALEKLCLTKEELTIKYKENINTYEKN
jgi:hypothetical protein